MFKITRQQTHGSLNVPIEHHPTIRYMVYNGYYKVMSNIPKMGHLPTPETSPRDLWIMAICQVSTGYFLDGQLIACIERLVWVTPLLRIENMLNTLKSGKSTREYHCITGIISLIFFAYDDYIFHHIPSISTIQIVCRIILSFRIIPYKQPFGVQRSHHVTQQLWLGGNLSLCVLQETKTMLSASSHPFHLGHFWLAWDAWAGFGPRGVKPLAFWVGDGRHALVILDYQLNDVECMCLIKFQVCACSTPSLCYYNKQPFVFAPHISDHAIDCYSKTTCFFSNQNGDDKNWASPKSQFQSFQENNYDITIILQLTRTHLTRDWHVGMRDTRWYVRTHGGQANQDWPLYPTSLGITVVHMLSSGND